MVVIAVAAAILAGTVLYTVTFLRLCQVRILTGELPPAGEISWEQSQ